MAVGTPLPPIPTWKAKHSREQLLPLMNDLATFNRAYRMETVSPGELMFPSVKSCYVPGISASELIRQGLPAYIGVDLSGQGRKGNCITAVGLRYPDLRRVVLKVRYGKWSSPDTAAVVSEVCRDLNVQYVMVENNGYQQALIDWVRESKVDFPWWMKIEAFTTTGSAKSHALYGLPGFEVEFKNKAWIWPLSEWEGHPPVCDCDWCHFKREFEAYPTGASTDGVMSCWFAREAINRWAPTSIAAPVRGRNVNQR